MLRLQHLIIVIAIGYTSCKQLKNPGENFSFNPDPALLYRTDVLRQTESHWEYKGKMQHLADTSETMYSFQLLHKTDSLFLIKLNFENFISSSSNHFSVNTKLPCPSLAEANANYLLYNYLLHFVKGRFVTVWLNTKGRPVGVNGIDRLVDSVAAISQIPAATVKRYLENYISEDVLKDELNRLFCFIPGKPKNAVQSWVENILLIAKAPVKWSTNFTLQSLKEDTAAIECNSFISARQGGGGRTYMKGKLTGNIIAGYSTGIPYKWNAAIETTTSTDTYVITTSQSITNTITPVKTSI